MRAGQSSALGQAPGPQSLVYETGCQCRLPPWWVSKQPAHCHSHPMTVCGSMTSSGGMPMTASGQPLSMVSSPCRACAISTNLGVGHRGWWSVIDCSSSISQGGVVGTSIFVVAHLVLAMDWLSLWATNRDPLGWSWLLQLGLQFGWGSHGMGFVGWGKHTSVQLDGSVAAKTSTSVNEASSSITCWSSIMLLARQQGWPQICGWAFSTQIL